MKDEKQQKKRRQRRRGIYITRKKLLDYINFYRQERKKERKKIKEKKQQKKRQRKIGKICYSNKFVRRHKV